MPDITATCIILHNLCIVNNKDSEEEWITEAENKLATRVTERNLWERSELRRKSGSYWSEKKSATEVAPIFDKVYYAKTKLFLQKENDKTNNLIS
jgi:hypothetical protein